MHFLELKNETELEVMSIKINDESQYGLVLDAFKSGEANVTEVSPEIAERIQFANHLAKHRDSQAAYDYARKWIEENSN